MLALKQIEATEAPKAALPVVDPPDDDPWADELIIDGMKPVTTPAGISTHCEPAPSANPFANWGPAYVPVFIRTYEIVRVRPDFSEDFYTDFS